MRALAAEHSAACGRIRFGALQRFADGGFADHISRVVDLGQSILGLFYAVAFQLCELEAAFAIEFVLDDVFGRLGHGHFSCL